MSALDPSLLTSVDKHGDRIKIIPAEVRGTFRKYRSLSQGLLLILFLAVPWTTINGHQTIQLNIPQREFSLFGFFLRAHDAPLMFFILATLALGLAFVTSIWGRVWCGWACPQTVFIDGVFRSIEYLVEGPYIKRRQLRDSPLSVEKIIKLLTKWTLFGLASAFIAHSFMAYFIGANDLIEMMKNAPSKNLNYFTLTFVFTAIVLFDFAWFREQFCIIMCPYGRIQSVLLDQSSLAVVYDETRGEPRKGHAKANEKRGDCVSCNRCVQVCPTGIDIRNGLQMECIACTACIDACNEIMTKVKKPTGLIRYATLDGSKLKLTKPRSIIYILAITILISGLTYALARRPLADYVIMRGQGLPFSHVQGANNEDLILNQFKVHIQNQSTQNALYELSLSESYKKMGLEINVAENPLPLAPQQFREWYFFIRYNPALLAQKNFLKVQIEIKDLKNEKGFMSTREITLVGPRK